MRTPHHPHARPPPRLHPRHTILKHQTLLRPHLCFPFRSQFRIYSFQRQQVDIWRRFASSGRDAGVVAEDAVGGGKSGEEGGVVCCFQFEVSGVGGGGEGEVDGGVGGAAEGF